MLAITGVMEDTSFHTKARNGSGLWETTFCDAVTGKEVTRELSDYQLASCLYLAISGGDAGEGLPETVEDIWAMAESAVVDLPPELRIIP